MESLSFIPRLCHKMRLMGERGNGGDVGVIEMRNGVKWASYEMVSTWHH